MAAGGFELNSARARLVAGALAIALTGTAVAQQGSAPAPDRPQNSASPLQVPENAELFGTSMPSVVKATAIVNGEVITQTDIDQRLALLIISAGGRIPADEVERLRQQVLRNLIDETLQIQAAKAEEIEIKPAEIDRTLERVASQNKQTVDALASLLKVVLMPTVAWLLARFVFGFTGEALFATVILAALPTAQNVYNFAHRYDRQVVVARDAVLVASVAAVPSMVVIAALLA